MTGPRDWLTSHMLTTFLRTRRDNDVKVEIRGILVPIANIYYHPTADSYAAEVTP